MYYLSPCQDRYKPYPEELNLTPGYDSHRNCENPCSLSLSTQYRIRLDIMAGPPWDIYSFDKPCYNCNCDCGAIKLPPEYSTRPNSTDDQARNAEEGRIHRSVTTFESITVPPPAHRRARVVTRAVRATSSANYPRAPRAPAQTWTATRLKKTDRSKSMSLSLLRVLHVDCGADCTLQRSAGPSSSALSSSSLWQCLWTGLVDRGQPRNLRERNELEVRVCSFRNWGRYPTA